MVVRYLLDTTVISELARPRPEPTVMARLEDDEDAVALSAVTTHELRYGVDRLPTGRRRDALAAFVHEIRLRFPALPYDTNAVDYHARERARLERTGAARPFADGQIAAIAVTRGLALVTRNARDVTGHTDLEVVSWWPSDDPGQ